MIETTQDIRLDMIQPGSNDRKLFKADELRQLADNIKTNGLAQPITVRPVGKNQYQIVAGERRFRAFGLLREEDAERWGAITALVREMSDEKADAIMLAENIQRKDLDVIEEAEAYQKRMDKYGWTLKKCAEECNVSEGRVGDRVKLLKLLPEVQTLVRHGHMPIGHALAMTDLNKNNQLIALKALDGKNLTKTQYIAVCADLYAKQCQLSMFDDDQLFNEAVVLAQSFIEPVNTTIVFEIPNNRATIHVVIEYPKGLGVEIDTAAIAKLITFK